MTGPYNLHWKCDKCGWIKRNPWDPGDGGLCPDCGNTSSIKHLIRVITAREVKYWWNPITWFITKWEEV